MNKTVLALAIFAFCLFPQVLSSGVRGNNDRELASISLGNLGNIIGGLLGGNKNTTSTTTNTTVATNSTSSTNTTAPANNSSPSNSTAPANNTSSSNTTAPANNTSSANTTAPVTNSTSANTTAPVNNTSSANTTAPVNNSTSAVNNTNNTSSTPANNTATTNNTQPSDTNNTSSVVNGDNSTSNSSSTDTNTTITPAPTTPVNNNWYARNDVDRAAFKDKCLIIHNILRQAVGVPDLTWSDSLAASAQAWAENMAVNGFRHSGRTGENIASTTYSTKVTVRLLGLWTNEQDWFIKGCTYPKCSSNGNEVGHYTQMVWAKTTQVGCGFAPGVNKQWNYLCCQYYKAGNVIGQTVYPYTAPAV